MGLFNKHKHDIVPKEKDLNCVVTKYSKVAEIKINAKLVVPDGFMMVVGKKGKALDKFEAGEHYFNFANLPIMCRKFHIDNTKKYGNKKQFPADFYFIKNDLRCGSFETYRKVEMGTKAYGIFKTKVFGEYYFKVSDHKEFMQSLLNEYDYIKTGEAEKLLTAWVNDEVVKILEEQNFLLNDVVINNPIIAEALKNKLSKLFSVAGLELLEVKVTNFKLPKKYQNINATIKEVAENKVEEPQQPSAVNNVQNANNAQPASDINQQTEENLQVNVEKQPEVIKQTYYNLDNLDQDLKDAKNLLKEFGIEKEETLNLNNLNQTEADCANNTATNNEVETQGTNDDNNANESDESNVVESSTENNAPDYVPFGSFVIEDADCKTEIPVKEKTFVDLSLNQLYNSTEKTKRCLNCGTENNLTADHCIICGEKFNKGEFYENN